MGRESMHREAIQALHCDGTKGRSEVTNDGLGRASLDAHVEKIIGERCGGARLQSEVISCHQRSSERRLLASDAEELACNQRSSRVSSEVIRGHQRYSEVIRTRLQEPSDAGARDRRERRLCVRRNEGRWRRGEHLHARQGPS
jgi:hypothetical protein